MKQVRIPPEPTSLLDTGLSESFLADLVLKHVFFGGTLNGMEISQRVALEFHLVAQVLEQLKKQELVTARGGSGAFGGVWIRWTVTRQGRERVEEILLRDNYRGPAPVPFEQYLEQLKHQSIRHHTVTPDMVEKAFGRLVLDPMIAIRIGPAINSGRSIFLYGPPGNGKTSMAECITATIQGGVFTPYAILIESEIVIILDELYHKPIRDHGLKHDKRWVYTQRPIVVVGGELSLEMLDLTANPQHTFYKAPFQVKANCGVLFIDDFGRQRVDPQDLLNRWIVPLESNYDFLTFHSGQKAKVPFDNLIVFSTNLNPRDLVDDAFLRRIRYKIEVGPPTEGRYKRIFARMCEKHAVRYDPAVVDYLLAKHYRDKGRQLRACEPRDLVEQMVDIHKYTGNMPGLTPQVVDHMAELYFVEL